MRIYVDTSVLVSLYTADVNSASAAALIADFTNDYVISAFGVFETFNAFRLRVFRKEISAAQAEASWRVFSADVAAGIFELKALPDDLFEHAQLLSKKATARIGTRTVDLLHVAAALDLGAAGLFSFDRQQRKLAEAVQLKLN